MISSDDKLAAIREEQIYYIGKNYCIDRGGVVRSRPRMGTKGGIVKTWIARGYKMVRIHEKGRKRIKSIHRLLAEAFIPNPKKLPEVNHIDGNPVNNFIGNLEWVTGRENQRHSYRIGLRKTTSISGKKYIYRDKLNKKWRVIITNPDGSKSRLGRFNNLKEAIQARDLILKKYD